MDHDLPYDTYWAAAAHNNVQHEKPNNPDEGMLGSIAMLLRQQGEKCRPSSAAAVHRPPQPSAS
jgi:hypothetical protein